MGSRIIAYVAVALALGCRTSPPSTAPIPAVSTGKLRVRVIAEPAPVRLLASAGRFVFVATDRHLERWDDQDRVSPLPGFTGAPVSLAPDHSQRGVWVLTDSELGRYDVASEQLDRFVVPASAQLTSVAPGAGASSAWLGTSSGLYRVDASGAAPIELVPSSGERPAVLGLATDRAGWLWVVTKHQLFARRPSGELAHIDLGRGFAITEPRLITELPDDRMLVVGAGPNGREHIAIGSELRWTTYRMLPEARVEAVARRGTGAVIMTGGRVYHLANDAATPRPLARRGMRLVEVAGASHRAALDWQIDPLELDVPPGALALVSLNDGLLIGTRELGTARYREGDAQPRDWLRRRQMFLDATSLSVACARIDDCWVATGARRAWHWDGDRFTPRGPDDIVDAVVRDPRSNTIYALHRADHDAPAQLSRIASLDGWSGRVAPGEGRDLSFARIDNGRLTIGYRDREDLTTIDLETMAIDKPRPALANATTVESRGDISWAMSSEAVARFGAAAEFWTLTGARALAIANDEVYVATASGAWRYDGTSWEAPPVLGFAVNDLVATTTGQLWMATDRGIAAWDGQRVRRIDTRRGLAENSIRDVAVDQFDRVWARGAGSLALVSQ